MHPSRMKLLSAKGPAPAPRQPSASTAAAADKAKEKRAEDEDHSESESTSASSDLARKKKGMRKHAPKNLQGEESEKDCRLVLLKNVPQAEVSNTMLYRSLIRFGSIKSVPPALWG